jgi:hypothetical protein
MLMLCKKLLGAIAVGAFALSAAVSYAGVPPDAVCKDVKGKEAGKYVLNTAKAFGANIKVANTTKLGSDLSKAHSKITKGFTKAEFSGSGAAKGCDTIEDVDDIEAKGDALVADVLDELAGAPFCPTTLSFTTGLPGGNCGRINDDAAGTGTDLVPYGGGSAQLDCGTLYIGGGNTTQAPSPTPDGASNIFNVTDCSVPSALPLAAATSVDTGSNNDCTAPGCNFGPPLPIPNTGNPPASTCVYNVIAASPAAGGILNGVAGTSTQTLPLTVTVRITGDLQPDAGIQPCPTCTGGTCDSGSNSGGGCTTTSSLLTSHDCPVTQGTLAPFNVDLSPLTTGTATDSVSGGVFCAGPPVQRTAGCFGHPSSTGSGLTCEYIEANGVPAGDLMGGSPLASTLASSFCIAKSSAALINGVADLPGPGAVTLKGSADLD